MLVPDILYKASFLEANIHLVLRSVFRSAYTSGDKLKAGFHLNRREI